MNALSGLEGGALGNGKFAGALQVMRTDFLKSVEFGEFLDRLDKELLKSRTARSIFSGQLKAEYIDVLANSLTYENLQDESLNDFINKIDIGSFNDGSFANFIATTEAYVLTDGDFTEAIGRVSDAVLTNGNFTEDVQSFNAEVRTTNLMSSLIFGLSDRDLARRDGYESILELNSGSAVVASNANTINLNPSADAIARRPTYELDNPGLIIGGTIVDDSSPIKLVGFQESRNRNITSDSQTWVIIHGFASSSDGENINLLEQSVLENAKPNDRVLSLDWREAAANQIVGAAPGISMTWGAPVAEYAVQTLINEYGISTNDAANKVNLIGHSLGAYVAGEIGKAFRDGFSDNSGTPTVIGNGIGVRTITALDPASELFNPLTKEIEKGLSPFDVDGRIAGIQEPQAFKDVARFSRAFNGSSSPAGNTDAAQTAHEYIRVSPEGISNLDQHAGVVRVFANIDNQTGRIGNNLGIRAYADTSGSLGLKEWKKISGLPLSGGGRNYTATLYTDANDQSEGLIGQTTDNPRDRIFIGGFKDDIVPGGDFIEMRSATNSGIYYGEGGDDKLTGSNGADTFIGGSGVDTLTGLGGSDTFVLEIADGIDVIQGFNVDEDILGLSSGLMRDDLLFGLIRSDPLGTSSSTIIQARLGFQIENLAIVEGVPPSVISGQAEFVRFPLDPFGLA